MKAKPSLSVVDSFVGLSVFGIVVPKRIVPTDAFTKRTAHCQDHDGFFVTVKGYAVDSASERE